MSIFRISPCNSEVRKIRAPYLCSMWAVLAPPYHQRLCTKLSLELIYSSMYPFSQLSFLYYLERKGVSQMYRKLLPLYSVLLVGCLSSEATATIIPTLTEITSSDPGGVVDNVEQTPVPTLVAISVPSKTPVTTETNAVTLTPPSSQATVKVEPLMFQESRLDDFLFNEEPPDNCTLPCWQGLMAGQSKLVDVQDWFGTNFSAIPPIEQVDEAPPGLQIVSSIWSLSSGSYEDIAIGFWIDSDSDILQGISFSWDRDVPNIMSPQRIIQELGVPSYWFAEIEGILQATIFSLMLYEDGLAFWHYGETRAIITSERGIMKSAIAEFCLNRTDFCGNADISLPFEDGLDELSSFQEFVLEVKPQRPIQEISGSSLDNIALLASSSPIPCLTMDLLGQ